MVKHTHLFWGGRTEWASNLVCSSQHGFVGQLCFPILQKWKVNDTECEIKRKEKSMAVKERYAGNNMCSLLTPQTRMQSALLPAGSSSGRVSPATASWCIWKMQTESFGVRWRILPAWEVPVSLSRHPPPPQLGRGRRELAALPGRLYRLQFQASLSLWDQDSAIK